MRTLLFLLLSALALHADDWPQWLGPQRDGVWRETGILKTFPTNGPTVRWRTNLLGGYAGPAVAGGRVFVTDRRLETGAKNPANAFQRGQIPGSERVLCLNETNGQTIWQFEYDCAYTVSYPAGPRATPTVSGGKVYTLGTEGDLICFEAAKGKILWQRNFKEDYQVQTPMWGFTGHPLIDGQKLICLVGGAGSVAVAFDKDTGKELWRALTAKEPGYCPPTIIEAGGKRQLIIWHPESVNSLDPETGKVYWSEKFSARMGLSVATPRHVGEQLLITAFYDGAMMLQLDRAKPAATVLWRAKKSSERDTDTLHSIMPTPFLEDGHIYGVCSYGQLRCLKADTGERVWETFAATGGKEVRWGNAFLVKNTDRYFIFNEKGDLLIARLTPQGYNEISRAHLLEPTSDAAGRPVVWSHPAYANRCAYIRNDKEIICVNLAEK